ncbi:hypothetical protein LKF24_2005 [Lactococcus lactis subsp. lactis]|nr:hypothetical protein LKF24_2005 [Lactococcus lactis subsp. lactis]
MVYLSLNASQHELTSIAFSNLNCDYVHPYPQAVGFIPMFSHI